MRSIIESTKRYPPLDATVLTHSFTIHFRHTRSTSSMPETFVTPEASALGLQLYDPDILPWIIFL